MTLEQFFVAIFALASLAIHGEIRKIREAIEEFTEKQGDSGGA